uniref:1,4-alpha-glucan branching enzyme n=1 Tax=Rhabditophanes sp. KR3021 TaxID=114890 RepID=A0AC35UGP8_9BILA
MLIADMEQPPKLDDLLRADEYLGMHSGEITRRYHLLQKSLKEIEELGGIDKFTQGYKDFGIHILPNNSIHVKEWAPGADRVSLVGDFNMWNTESHTLAKDQYGVHELIIPPGQDNKPVVEHMSRLKLFMSKGEEYAYKISPWATTVFQDKDETVFKQRFYNPPQPYQMTAPQPDSPSTLRIYEAHVGIANEEYKISSYTEFADNILPRIKAQNYNAIQLMAVMEHAYYASFGYQITSFFGVSSRFGTPCELKYLLDKAHALGIVVLLDVVHSHASKNVDDGLNYFDMTKAGYFHGNVRGTHKLWDSRLFDYKKTEVLRFLLSNLRYWVDEYKFDGFRFDGVTSMIYHSHGIDDSFTGGYQMYFGPRVDDEALTYLSLANHFLHTLYPNNMITIAEEVSGMPALCRPIAEGGQGFDYRLAMAIPDMWIKLFKHTRDEDWDIPEIVQQLENRRYNEKHVAYVESHDQALVGDKTLAFWLMDKEMYDHMSISGRLTTIIDRGMAIHKMIRLLTYGLGGEAWLNFIGNEFGHPEWLDFPRVGNDNSFHYCRRQFSLVDNQALRYKFLNNWDREVNALEIRTQFLSHGPAFVSCKHQQDKVITFDRNNVIFIFNFHPTQSFAGYRVAINEPGKYKTTLQSDDCRFGGHNRIEDQELVYQTTPGQFNGRAHSLLTYIPSRTCIVMVKVDDL